MALYGDSVSCVLWNILLYVRFECFQDGRAGMVGQGDLWSPSQGTDDASKASTYLLT